MHFKYDQNLLLLWSFLLFQIIVLLGYFKFSSSWNNNSVGKTEKLVQPIKFIENIGKPPSHSRDLNKYSNYYNSDINTEIYLKTENVGNYFVIVNDTICFQFGTDTRYMKGNKIKTLVNDSIKCECLPGYHGNDCSLPEVIWRAFIAYRQETVIHKRKGNMRRIIHMFTINHQADIPLAVIKINELYDTVDLFIVTESNRTQYGNTKPFYFKKKLDEGLCREKQDKILYTPINKGWKDNTLSQVVWEKSRKIIKNLRDDDLFIYLDSSEIPNIKALLFFKLYDGFALPFQFRMKWNVYGYFYQHPEKTKQITTGVTAQMLDDIYKSNQDSTANGGGLVIGDLNHYGGWLCEFCYDAKVILRIIQTSEKFASLLPSRNKVMDVKYVEEFIGNGLYVDGKTALIKKSEESDTYFAPAFATQQYWKFDFLLINFYNKIDYN